MKTLLHKVIVTAVLATALAAPAEAASAPPTAESPDPAEAVTTESTVVESNGAPFVPVTASRLLDTRPGARTVDGSYAGTGPVGRGGFVNLKVAGRGGVPSAGAGAVVLTLTVTNPTASGHLTAWPSGDARPNSSNLNYTPGQRVTNAVAVRLGRDGFVSLYSHAAVQLAADIAGWFPEGSGLSPVVPARILDTRPGARTADGKFAGTGAMPARGIVNLTVAGRGGVPRTGAGSVVLNVTAVSPRAAGHLTVWPAATARPNASNVNYIAGQTVANVVVVRVGSTGGVGLYTQSASHVLVDVAGWFPDSGGVQAVAPSRILDTRTRGSMTGNQAVTELAIAGRGGVPASGATAAVLTVTATGGRAAGFVTAWPAGAPRPAAAHLSYAPGRSVASLVVAELNDRGSISLYTQSATHLIVDVAGWFAAGVIDTSTVEVPATTKIVGAADLVGAPAAGEQPNESVITLAASADVVAVGDHLAIAVSPAFPSGYLGKAIRVDRNADGSARVTLLPSSLEDAMPSGDISYNGPIDALARAASTGVTAQGNLLALPVGLNCDGQLLQAQLKLDPSITVDLRMKWGLTDTQLERLSFDMKMPMQLSLSGGLHGSCVQEGRALMGWNTMIGGVLLTFYLKPYIEVSGSVTAWKWEIGPTIRAQLGWHRINGALQPFSSADAQDNVTPPSLSRPEGELRIGVGLKLEAQVYRALTAGFYAGPEMGLTASRDGANYTCTATRGVRVKASVGLDLKIAKFTSEIGSALLASQPLGHLPCGTEPPPAVSTTALPEALVSDPYSARLAHTGGLDPVSWSATGLPAGLSLSGSTISGTPTTAGQYPIRVAATDSAGRAASRDLVLKVVVPARGKDALKGKIARLTDGRSWYVDKRGDRHAIRDGGTYECLVAQGVVVAITTLESVTALTLYEDAQCIRANPGDIIRHPDGDAYLVEPDWTRRWIPDGGTYECLTANGRRVVAVPRYYLMDLTQGPDFRWSCWDANAAKGHVVRTPDGKSYYVDLRGGRHWIPDGGTYECLVAQGKSDYGHLVPAGWVTALTQYENAQCIRANPGDIIRHPDGDAYLVEGDWSRRWIPDGGTYECLTANGHRVVTVTRYYLMDLRQGADFRWSCWDANAAKGRVVRTTDGSSWYVDLRGSRHWIPDGGTYQCLVAQGKSDYGNVVPRAWLNGIAQYENAQCVRANVGDIIRHSDGDSYIFGGSSKRWIPNGATYNCFRARGRALVNNVPRYWVSDLASGTNLSTGEACNLILRHATAGDAHFIDGSGYRHWIPDGGTYQCLTGRGLPVFNTTDRGLIDSGWTQAAHARCP